MNASTVKILMLAALTAMTVAATGCTAPVAGASDEQTAETAEAIASQTAPPFTAGTSYTIGTATTCGGGTLGANGSAFELALKAAGCSTNKTLISVQCAPGQTACLVVHNYYEVTCPLIPPAGKTAASNVVSQYSNVQPYMPTVQWESAGKCVTTTSSSTFTPIYPAPANSFYVDFDPTGGSHVPTGT